MDNEIRLSEEKVLKFNEKAFSDTKQLTKNLSCDYIEREIENLMNIGDKYKDILQNLSFPKGKRLWIEVDVEDSYLSGMLMNWLYGKSEIDGKPLHAFGCSINSIYFEKPSGYSDEVKAAIIKLYDDVIGIQK